MTFYLRIPIALAGLRRKRRAFCPTLTGLGSWKHVVEFARVHGLKIVTAADIIECRLRNETMVQRAAEARLPTAYGEFRAMVYAPVAACCDGEDRGGGRRRATVREA